MFPVKKKKFYGNCPSCKGDYLIYRFRSFNNAYFSCAKCGYTQVIFDPWEPVGVVTGGSSRKTAAIYNEANRAARRRQEGRPQEPEKQTESLEQLKEILREIAENQTTINAKVDTILGLVRELKQAGLLPVEYTGQNTHPVNMTALDDEEYLSTVRAAELLGFTTKNAYQKVLNLIHKGKLSAKKPGRSYIVAKTELERFLMENNI
jgi:excisionase family DNA binding protein